MSDLGGNAPDETASPDGETADPVGEPSMITGPIFIVGCPRSGTTMLRMCIDSHPRISCGREEMTLYELQRLDTDAHRQRRQDYGLSDHQWHAMIRRMIDGLTRPYARSQGKTRWALKFPQLAIRIPWLNKLYPDCQVVHMVRDPRDVIVSSHKQFGRRRTIEYGERWVRYVSMAERDGAMLGPGRFKTVRYEDLVRGPEPVLRELVDWFGEPWSDAVLHPEAQTHDYPVKRIEAKRSSGIQPIPTRNARRDTSFLPIFFVWLAGTEYTRHFGYDISIADLLTKAAYRAR